MSYKMSNQVNISNLRNYLTQVVANQAKVTQPAYANKYSLVNAVTTTSSSMNINPKTGTITVPTSTGPIQVPQPVINPLPVNSTTAFVSTNNNQVSVTSQGSEDTIITSKLVKITNIQDVTNSGYTKNNSVANLYDSVSNNYWNPQLNLSSGTGTNPFLYTLNYTFENISEIYKFSILNNVQYPGFTNIKLYETLNPFNYININPYVDFNGNYNNSSFALLLDNNGNPLFKTDKISAEFTLYPQTKPNISYQYGKANGILYNNGNNIQIRTGNFIANNSSNGNYTEWTLKEVENLSTSNGTSNSNNNYISSKDGVYQIVYNTENYSYSLNSSNSFTKVNFLIEQMTMSDDGLYVMANYYNSVANKTTIYYSNDYGQTLTQNNDIFVDEQGIQDYVLTSSKNGKNVFLVQKNSITGFPQELYHTYQNQNYGNAKFVKGGAIEFTDTASFTIYKKIINTFCTNIGDIQVIMDYYSYESVPYNNDGKVYFIKAVRTPGLPYDFYTWMNAATPIPSNRIFTIETNYSDDTNIDGKYKTCFGYTQNNRTVIINGNSYNLGTQIYKLAIFYTLDDSNYTSPYSTTYVTIDNGDLFSDYYLPIINDQYSGNQFSVKDALVKISSSGQYQVLHVVYQYQNYPDRPNMCKTYYSTDFGQNWSKSTTSASLLNEIGNIVANDDFSVIQISGGLTYKFDGKNYTTTPITYISYDYGNNWTLNSALNPATEIISTNFYSVDVVTNKTYFQIKNLNQEQVLGVSDNGFKMTKDLRVINSNAYVLGGNMTIGPDEASALLNDYTLNVDGTISAKGLVLLSDKRFKNIKEIIDDKDSYDKLKNIDIVKYCYKNKQDKDYIGMVAQDLEKVYSDTIEIGKSTIKNDEDDIIEINDVYSINYNSLLSRLISAVKYSQIKIENLENEIFKLKNN